MSAGRKHPFLDYFPTWDRSTISNWFLDPIREAKRTGLKMTPRQVVDAVLLQADRQMRWSCERCELTIAVIGEFEESALSYAVDRIAYVERGGRALTWTEEQELLPIERRDPITDAQAWKLRSLGVPPRDAPPDKLTAHRMITERLEGVTP